MQWMKMMRMNINKKSTGNNAGCGKVIAGHSDSLCKNVMKTAVYKISVFSNFYRTSVNKIKTPMNSLKNINHVKLMIVHTIM